MKFNYKKIASVLASAIMLSSTVGFAAAASTYPTPFVAGGTADGAVVVGSASAPSDWAAAIDVGQKLNALVTTATTTTGASTTGGDATPLFTSGSLLFLNDSLNSVKSTLTKSEMPTVLADSTFSGNVDAKVVQSIIIGTNPSLTFEKQPTSSDDPQVGLKLSTNQANVIYNATIDFGKAVNFTHADSKNQELILFGQKYTVGSSTDSTNLILLKSATKVDLDSSGTTSSEVTVAGNTYTVELVSASATTATVKVTNAAGVTEQKEITEGYSKKVNGITIAVNTADTNNLKYTASVVAGADKVTLTTGSAVKVGESDTIIDGTLVTITGGLNAMTKIVIGVYASESDKDAILPGKSFVDPVFGSFKVDFSGLNIPNDFTSTTRESITFTSSGDNKELVELTDHRGYKKNFQWAINNSNAIALDNDDQGHDIVVTEYASVNKTDYVILGNEDEGRLLKVTTIYNSSTSTASDDKVEFQDVFSGETITTSITTEGTGTVQVGGKSYTVTYNFTSSLDDTARTIMINSPDSSGNDLIIYPTIQTSKGAKIMFYKPLVNVSLSNWEGNNKTVLGANLKIPNGARAYQSIAIATAANGTSVDSTVLNSSDVYKAVTITNTGLKLNFTYTGENRTSIYLTSPDGGAIVDPALIIIEEKDDNNQYQAVIVTLRPGTTSTTGIGISDIKRTWGADGINDVVSLYTNTYKTQEMDLWGAIGQVDTTASAHPTGIVSYPDSQVYGQIYMAANGAVITPGTVSGGLGGQVLVVKDTEVSSASDKNLFVVGGSCINAVAAKILGSDIPVCGADFTDLAKISAGGYIIKTVESPYNAAKVAMLVAGYNADDTTRAVAKALTGVATDKDTSTTDPVLATA